MPETEVERRVRDPDEARLRLLEHRVAALLRDHNFSTYLHAHTVAKQVVREVLVA